MPGSEAALERDRLHQGGQRISRYRGSRGGPGLGGPSSVLLPWPRIQGCWTSTRSNSTSSPGGRSGEDSNSGRPPPGVGIPPVDAGYRDRRFHTPAGRKRSSAGFSPSETVGDMDSPVEGELFSTQSPWITPREWATLVRFPRSGEKRVRMFDCGPPRPEHKRADRASSPPAPDRRSRDARHR
jgi:hypothetical protein